MSNPKFPELSLMIPPKQQKFYSIQPSFPTIIQKPTHSLFYHLVLFPEVFKVFSLSHNQCEATEKLNRWLLPVGSFAPRPQKEGHLRSINLQGPLPYVFIRKDTWFEKCQYWLLCKSNIADVYSIFNHIRQSVPLWWREEHNSPFCSDLSNCGFCSLKKGQSSYIYYLG